jgi:hypothetical protein
MKPAPAVQIKIHNQADQQANRQRNDAHKASKF